MKRVTLRFREVDRDKFNAIKDGTKKVETRAATEKFSSCETGDILILVCAGESSEKKIKKATRFDSLEKLFVAYSIKDILPTANSVKAARIIYYSFPGYKDKIAEFGIMAFELEQG
jgi:ASC-1-like (ASCH) protein